MEPDDFERIRRCVGFDAAAEATLAELAPLATPELRRLAEEFYETIVRNAVVDPSRVELALEARLATSLSGPHDHAWIEGLERVGSMYVRLGLPPCSLLVATTRLRAGLIQLVRRVWLREPGRFTAGESAIRALVDLELAVLLDAYHDQLSKSVRGAERAATLEESESRHRELVEAVPALVMALGAEGEIQVWNRRLEEVTGLSREEMLGRSGRDFVGEGGERRLALKSGGHRWIRWQLAHVAPSTLAVGIDVTSERAAQRRTLMDERLAAVGTLAAGLAHEVRNPLNSATLQLQVLRRRVERGQNTPELLVPVVEIVHDEIRRLDRLVSDFLAFARPNPLVLESVDLSELVASVIAQLRPEAEAARVTIDLRLEQDSCIDGDPPRLRQIMLNLMRNGIEAMQASGGVLDLAVRSDAEGGVEAIVADTGPGLDENAPIFDAFYTTKEAGTGLGLAIVHRIVREHGGTIHFDSRPGRTQFTIRFPPQVRE